MTFYTRRIKEIEGLLAFYQDDYPNSILLKERVLEILDKCINEIDDLESELEIEQESKDLRMPQDLINNQRLDVGDILDKFY